MASGFLQSSKATLLLLTVFAQLGCMKGLFNLQQSDCGPGEVKNAAGFCHISAANAAVDDRAPKLKMTSGCVDPDLTHVLTTDSITLCNGTLAKGTLTICTGDGQSNCVNAGSFKAADTSKYSAAKISSGVTVAGIAGTLVIPATTPNCTTDGQTGCIVSGTLKSADTTAITTYDLRQGKTIAGIAGARKDCRNGMNSAIFNYDNAGDPLAIGTGGNVAGTNGDWWDTIDDYNNNGASGGTFGPLVSTAAWSSTYYCDGSQITDVTNSQTWLTPAVGGTTTLYCSGTTCTNAAAHPFNKIYYDGYTSLYVSNPLIQSGGAAAAGAGWDEATSGCYKLQSGDGVGKWRLPTQKELMQLYIGGIFLQNAAKFSSMLADYFWSASSSSAATTVAWYLVLGDGTTTNGSKTNGLAVLCVR